MATFTPRLEAPTDFSTYYGSRNAYNRFERYYGNCTWYAYGRSGEIAQHNIYNEFIITRGRGDGKDWVENTWQDHTITAEAGDPVEIKLGDILVWGGGTYGHVEVVEQILTNTIGISYSLAGNGYADSLYWGMRYLPKSLSWGDYLGQVEHNDGSTAYLYNTLIGIIHNPYAEDMRQLAPVLSATHRRKLRNRRRYRLYVKK